MDVRANQHHYSLGHGGLNVHLCQQHAMTIEEHAARFSWLAIWNPGRKTPCLRVFPIVYVKSLCNIIRRTPEEQYSTRIWYIVKPDTISDSVTSVYGSKQGCSNPKRRKSDFALQIESVHPKYNDNTVRSKTQEKVQLLQYCLLRKDNVRAWLCVVFIEESGVYDHDRRFAR